MNFIGRFWKHLTSLCVINFNLNSSGERTKRNKTKNYPAICYEFIYFKVGTSVFSSSLFLLRSLLPSLPLSL